jgi:hypothetical protein
VDEIILIVSLTIYFGWGFISWSKDRAARNARELLNKGSKSVRGKWDWVNELSNQFKEKS